VQEGQTIVMVTHERSVQEYASRTILLADGRIEHTAAAAHA
jgi:ABC-type lipoprotein export system ATPase subunit